jgi:hypothetical protein
MHGSCFALVPIGIGSLHTAHITLPLVSWIVERIVDARFSIKDVAAGGAPLLGSLSSANCSRSI